ncbi:hypothetical protein Ancab_005496 [Ancistrocladus abbreviatus]
MQDNHARDSSNLQNNNASSFPDGSNPISSNVIFQHVTGDDLATGKFIAGDSHREHKFEAQKSLIVINDSVEGVREETPRVDGRESGKHSWHRIFRDGREKINRGEVPRREGAVVDFGRLETGSIYANSGDPKLLWAATEDVEAVSV